MSKFWISGYDYVTEALADTPGLGLVSKLLAKLTTEAGMTVETKTGAVRGSTMKSRTGKTIYSFRGLPYARPPVGALRFRRSEPVQAWPGVLDGTREAKKCQQPNVLAPDFSLLTEGGEDCLYLNVYTKHCPRPGSDPASLLPVIVFLHGGAFVVGSCEAMLYGPQILLDREVVLVGVNYRLGALGFLSLECDEAPGNLGLHDQFLALSWVRDNIAQFGGDPGNVTLLGGSAGAMSAVCHLVSPLSRGLFHRVIPLSGTMASTFMHNDRSPRCYAVALATRLGYSGDQTDNSSLLTFLQSQPASSILKASLMFLDWDYADPMPWTPSLDPACSQPFLPLSLSEAVKTGEVSEVPVMFGLCAEDGLILSAHFYRTKERWELLRSDWESWAPLVLFGRERSLARQADREAARDIGQFYYGAQTDIASLPSEDETLSKLTRMYSMSYFHSATDQDARVLAQAGHQVHVMILSHPPAFSLMELFRLNMAQLVWMFTARSMGYNPYPQVYGTCHSDDIQYLFPMDPPGFPAAVVTENQKKVQQNLLDLVCSYASTGQPSARGLEGGLAQPLQPEDGISNYLRVDTTCSQEEDQDLQEELRFWREVRERVNMDDWEESRELPTAFYDKIAIYRQ